MPYSKSYFSTIVLGAYAYVPLVETVGTSLIKDLTVFQKYDRTPYYMYKIHEKWFGIPLYYDNAIFDNSGIIDKRIIGNKINLKFMSGFRKGQEEVILQFEENYNVGKTGFILDAKPGVGKTVLAIKMISIIGKSTVIIVPRENLVWQWVDRIQEHSNFTKDDIGYVCGDRMNFMGKSIVVALVHTCATGKLPKAFFKNFGCVVFDEIHSSVPPRTFSPVLAMFPARVRIGMSATLVRDDGLDIIFRNHVGQVYLNGKSIEGRMQAKVIVHYFVQSSGYLHMKSGTKERRGMLLSKLAANYIRNKTIVRYILSFLKSRRRVVVLSDRVAQLKNIRIMLIKELCKYPIIENNKIGFYFGSMKKAALDNAVLCDVILATYQKFDLGTDIKDLAGVIYATPHKLVEQKQGRAERYVIGKKVPVVVDIVDVQYSDAEKWFEHRAKFYQSSGIELKKIVQRAG